MKISTFFLAVSGLTLVYLCYADWIDHFLDVITEEYLGIDYEEVAPFIPSGTKEFDSIVEELSRKRKNDNYQPNFLLFVPLLLLPITFLLAFRQSFPFENFLEFFKKLQSGLKFDLLKSKNLWQNKLESTEAIGKILNRKLKWNFRADDVPVHVIWKGTGLMESSVHCNLKDKSHGDVNDFAAGDVTPAPDKISNIQKLEEMRKLLESESTMTDKSAGTDDLEEESTADVRKGEKSETSVSSVRPKSSIHEDKSSGEDTASDKDVTDPVLMNRIRLLESRLRLEELKNRNWINRMSRAEGILKQLNRQVERIERSQPVETTLLETFKITSTVTKWMPVSERGNEPEFSVTKNCHQRQECKSLTEYIRREISLSNPCLDIKKFASLSKSPYINPLPSNGRSQESVILKKFLSR